MHFPTPYFIALIKHVTALFTYIKLNFIFIGFFLLLSLDLITSTYTLLGGFHGTTDAKFATNSLAGLCEFYRSIWHDRRLQERLLCLAFIFLVISTLSCYLTMSFLGLYGIFITQFIALFTFWSVALLNFRTFLLFGGTSHIIFFK